MTLKVNDADTGSNADFIIEELSIPRDPQTGADLFNVNPNTGVISVTQPLDRETQDSYTLVVRVTDRGNPALSCEFLFVLKERFL